MYVTSIQFNKNNNNLKFSNSITREKTYTWIVVFTILIINLKKFKINMFVTIIYNIQ